MAPSASSTTSTTGPTARPTTSPTRWPTPSRRPRSTPVWPSSLLPAAYHRNGWDGGDRPPAGGQRRFCDPDVETFLARVDALRGWARDRARRPRRRRRAQRPRRPGELARDDRRLRRAPRPRAPRPRPRAAPRARGVPRRARLHADRAARPHGLPVATDDRRPRHPRRRRRRRAPGPDRRRSSSSCPTTEGNLGDGHFPALRLRDAGVRIAIGSDSNVRIDPFEEVRELETGARRERETRFGLLAAEGDLWAALCRTGRREPRVVRPVLGPRSTVDLDHPDLRGVARSDLRWRLRRAPRRASSPARRRPASRDPPPARRPVTRRTAVVRPTSGAHGRERQPGLLGVPCRARPAAGTVAIRDVNVPSSAFKEESASVRAFEPEPPGAAPAPQEAHHGRSGRGRRDRHHGDHRGIRPRPPPSRPSPTTSWSSPTATSSPSRATRTTSVSSRPLEVTRGGTVIGSAQSRGRRGRRRLRDQPSRRRVLGRRHRPQRHARHPSRRQGHRSSSTATTRATRRCRTPS